MPDFAGKFVKDADKEITKLLKARGKMVQIGVVKHSYPFCWRSDTPLIYRAVPSTFINVESIKQKLLDNNGKTYWVPGFVKEKRFHNWLEDARDWAVRRNRFWGTRLHIPRIFTHRAQFPSQVSRRSVLGDADPDVDLADGQTSSARSRSSSSGRARRSATTSTVSSSTISSSRPPRARACSDASTRSSTAGSSRARCRTPR